MASPGGTSSGSSFMQCSDGDIMIDERKRKRMQSNRDSARRSRMRKQNHLNDLSDQIVNLKKVNAQMLTNISVTTQKFIEVESENSILRAQMEELTQRLESLNEINNVLGSNGIDYSIIGNNHHQSLGGYGDEFNPIMQGHFGNDINGILMTPWNSAAATCMNQPIMASADMFQY